MDSRWIAEVLEIPGALAYQQRFSLDLVHDLVYNPHAGV